MLAFDLHGVIMNIMPGMKKYFKEEVGFELIDNKQFNFDYPKWYDPRRFGPDIAAAIRKYGPAAKGKRDSLDTLRNWIDSGGDLLIITASAKSTMLANCDWLDTNLRKPYKIIRVNHADGKMKAIKEHGVTQFVDDRFKTMVDLAPHLEVGYLYSDTHNQGRKPPENIKRIRSLKEIL
jgi:hypothetical protein